MGTCMFPFFSFLHAGTALYYVIPRGAATDARIVSPRGVELYDAQVRHTAGT